MPTNPAPLHANLAKSDIKYECGLVLFWLHTRFFNLGLIHFAWGSSAQKPSPFSQTKVKRMATMKSSESCLKLCSKCLALGEMQRVRERDLLKCFYKVYNIIVLAFFSQLYIDEVAWMYIQMLRWEMRVFFKVWFLDIQNGWST